MYTNEMQSEDLVSILIPKKKKKIQTYMHVVCMHIEFDVDWYLIRSHQIFANFLKWDNTTATHFLQYLFFEHLSFTVTYG